MHELGFLKEDQISKLKDKADQLEKHIKTINSEDEMETLNTSLKMLKSLLSGDRVFIHETKPEV